MKKSLIPALLTVVAAILVIVYFGGINGCGFKWTQPDSQLTLEQKGLLVNLAAKNMIIQLRQAEPGEWEDYVCSLATIVVGALDGDEASIARLNTVLPQPLATGTTITLPMKTLLFDLLNYVARKFDIGGWETIFADTILVLDTFILSSVTTNYEVWYLTREFFVGIVAGCNAP